jgi:hypothetical protein
VAAATANDLRIWNRRSGQLVLEDEKSREKLASCHVSFAGGQPHLLASYRFLDTARHRFESLSAPDGRRTVQLAHNQTAWMFGCEGGGIVFREFDPDGVLCYELSQGRIRWRRPPFEDYAQRAAISRDGRWLVAGDVNRHALMLFDCRTGDVKYRVPCLASAQALAVADDGRSFFVGDTNGVVSIWSLEHGQKLFELTKFDEPIERLCSVEGALLVALSKKVDHRDVLCWYEIDRD